MGPRVGPAVSESARDNDWDPPSAGPNPDERPTGLSETARWSRLPEPLRDASSLLAEVPAAQFTPAFIVPMMCRWDDYLLAFQNIADRRIETQKNCRKMLYVDEETGSWEARQWAIRRNGIHNVPNKILDGFRNFKISNNSLPKPKSETCTYPVLIRGSTETGGDSFGGGDKQGQALLACFCQLHSWAWLPNRVRFWGLDLCRYSFPPRVGIALELWLLLFI